MSTTVFSMPRPFLVTSLIARSRFARLPQRGVVLLIVLVVVVMLALAAYTFSDLMMTHRNAVRWSGRRIQARLLAESGVAALQQLLALDEHGREEAGGVHDNPLLLRRVIVLDRDDPQARGGFSVVAAAMDQRGQLGDIRFGVEDESVRLNVNTLRFATAAEQDVNRERLMGLPGMTVDVADAILDWLDADDDARPFGAETDYYSSLVRPYAAKNGPLDSLEELLLVRGVTPALLYGRDYNHNNLVDPHEIRGIGSDDPNELGWSRFLTIYSNESSDALQHEQQERVYVNQDDLQQLYAELLEVFGNNRQWAMFVVAYRQNGPFDGDATLDATNRDLDLRAPARFPIRHVLDLVGQNVRLTMLGDSEPIVLASPFKADQAAELLPELEAAISVYDTRSIHGRINILKAPDAVLRTIPGIEEEMLDQILANRDSLPAPAGISWLLTQGIVTLDQMRNIAPYINERGSTCRAQVVGYLNDGHSYCRLEVVIESSGGSSRLLMCRDLSHLGRGFSMDKLRRAQVK